MIGLALFKSPDAENTGPSRDHHISSIDSDISVYASSMQHRADVSSSMDKLKKDAPERLIVEDEGPCNLKDIADLFDLKAKEALELIT